MNSSMLAGERRRASARRGGMTFLGKVAVPKPLNLPSQRLENHGLDPNVEIVPKGTLSWGSRPSSSGSNAWISSAPNADGGNTAHSHVSGRPSSGGSGTRPSTSESDRTNVPVANAWGSNSRPSTASGSLTSNQTSLRPRSAETRPNSSQVSRFSEPVSESSTAWGASGVGERLGVKSYKEDGFSLSSGDFPTLGSEKENSVMNMKSQDNCRPSSASDRTARAKEEDAKFHPDAQSGTMNILRTDCPRTAEDGIFPRMENWQGEPQQYFNTNMPSQHFDAWHSRPPFSAPAGPWYRGRPPGPAFGGHVAPGGFPMEPFPYYPPQISHPAVGGAQSVPPAGSGPRGTHPRNGDLYRPPMPDAYARPGIPFRPEFYRGPPVPPGQMTFEGYYGPPRGYCSNEREIPFMTPRPPSYYGFQALGAHDPANFPGGTIGHGPSGKTLPVQMETDQRSQQRVPSKNNSDWYQKDEEENWDRDIRPNVLYSGKGSLPTMTSQNNEWGAEEDVENDKYAKRTVPIDYSAGKFEHQGHPSDSGRVRSVESIGSGKLVNDNLTNELPNAASFPTEGCQIPLANERNPSLQGETKDSVLMQKQVLNAKFLVSSDGQSDFPNAFNREERRSRFQVEKKMHNCSVEGTNAAGSFERVPTSIDFGSALHQVTIPKQSTSAVSRSSYHGGHGRVNRVRDPNDAGKTAEDSMIDTLMKIEGEPAEETSDPSDIQEQRARRRELAKQRVLQLHKEEEERTRDQKAKAFAKLEELNRRTKVGETANKKETAESFDDIYGEQEILCTLGGTVLVDPKFQAPCQNLVSDSNVTSLESSISQSGEFVEVTKNLPVEPPQQLEPNLSHGQSLHMKDPRNARKVGMQLNDGGISKQNRIGYKQKQNKSLVKSSHEKSVANIASEAPEDLVSVPTNFTSTEASSSEIQSGDESNVLNTSNTVAEPSIQQRRKSNSSRNKHKLDEAPVFPVLSPVLSDSNPGKPYVENVESKASWSNLDSSAVTMADLDIEAKGAKAFSSLPNEGHNRVANQLKRQPFRKTLRSQQSNKFMDVHHNSDTVIWAPVRTQNKAESGTQVDKKSTLEVDNATNSDNMAQSSSKGKRAEMERYVPKPVAMELAQQGNTPHMPSPINMLKSDEVPGIFQFGSFGSVSPQPVGPVTVFIASKVETKEGEDKHKIHKKEHGTWRQRVSTDSSHMKGVNLCPALISEPSKDVPKSTEQHQFINSVTNSANADTSDSHSISDNTTTSAMSKIPAMKDHGPTVQGKRNLPWVPQSTGNNPDHGDIICNEIDGSGTLSAADVDRPDRTNISKDSRSRGDQPLSHWKPKLNSKFANNLHGNKTTGIETATMEITGASKKDHPSQKTVQVLPQNDKRSRNSYRPQPDQSVSAGQSVSESNVVEESVAGNQQEFDREKKPSSAKEPPFSLNQDPINSTTESAPSANTDIKHEHDISTGSRRIGKQNSRTMRGHESRGDWDASQENRPTHAHRFRERQRRSAHYEYQPVGPHKSSGPEKFDGPADGASNARLINQERGQNHPKHLRILL